MERKIRVAVLGAVGRMGRQLVDCVLNEPGMTLAAALEREDCPLLGQDAGTVAGAGGCGVALAADVPAALGQCDVVIDFTAAEVTRRIAPQAAAAGVAMVIGSTGLTDADMQALEQLAAAGARIVQAPNMSVGVNLLFALSRRVARTLGEDYDVEIVEMHHNQKKDAPSGTAERLGQIVCEERGLDYRHDTRHGREGLVGARTKHEIGMHSLRGGDVVGDHTVIFAAEGERLELTHKASSRRTFAAGAVRAAKFVFAAQPGRYDMQDVLGLKEPQ